MLKKGILLSITAICISLAFSVRAQIQEPPISIIPQPNSMEFLNGSFTLNSTTSVFGKTMEQTKVSNWFIAELQKQYNLNIVLDKNQRKKNQIILMDDENLGNEAYTMSVKGNHITIQASSESGYFYAFQSLLQMVPVVHLKKSVNKLQIPCANISDHPRFQWRGLMLDISRHFYGAESIKKLVDQMAAQKMNRLHLHLSDNQGWRIEIKEYPKLHEVGGKGDYSNPDGPVMYLSEEEARELTVYAKARQITIVPEIDMPGHSGAIGKAYPEFSGDENTINVASPEATKMVETVIHRLTDIFDTPYFHFGSDEVWGRSWEKRADTKAKMKELGFKSQKELEAWFDRKIADFIHEAGYIPIAWDEAAELKVNKHTIIQNWRWLDTNIGAEALNNGSRLILSPSNYLYLDYGEHLDEAGAYWKGVINGANSVELIYNWNPMSEEYDPSKLNNILGIEAPIWTEFISNQKRLEYMVFPRILAIAEKAWTEDENMNWPVFQKKMEAQFNRYDKLGINYRIPSMGVLKRKQLQPEAFEGPLPREKSKFLK